MSRVLKHTLICLGSQLFISLYIFFRFFFILFGPPIHWYSKPWDPFYLPLPFGFKGYWLFLLAFSFSFYFFSQFFLFSIFFSLLFLASRIIFMIFQILNNMSPFSSFFQEPTFMNHKFKIHMHCLSIHSENKNIATTSK